MEDKIKLISQFLELVMEFNEEVRGSENEGITFSTTNHEGNTHFSVYLSETDPKLREIKGVFKLDFIAYLNKESLEEIKEGIQPFIDYMTNFKKAKEVEMD